ncbi:unnamed protein product, partial [Polarella glacialis]
AEAQLLPKVVDALLGIHIVQVAAGYEHSLALSDTGEVFTWGSHVSGALGNLDFGRTPDYQALAHKAELGNIGRVREVACGAFHSLFLSDTGEAAERGDDLWLCGIGVTSAETAAWRLAAASSPYAGTAAAEIPGPPAGVPLKMKLVNVKRLLAKLN